MKRAEEIYAEMGDMQKFLFMDRYQMRWPTQWDDETVLVDENGPTELGKALYHEVKTKWFDSRKQW